MIRKKYIKKRKKTDTAFALDFDKGYENFKLGVLLKQAREDAGVTKEEVAQKLHTKNSAISQIENHAEGIRPSTLRKYAKVSGCQIRLQVA